MKIRGGSREMDLILKEAGAAVVSLPSNEIYAAMQTGAHGCGAHLVDLADLVPARRSGEAPDHRPRQVLLVHARAADDVEGRLRPLTKDQQAVIMQVGAEMEAFGKEAKADDEEVAKVYAKAVARPTI